MSSDELFLEELLEALASVRLEALIVGGSAAVLQGAPIMTQDVDLLLRDTPRNRQKITLLCERLGGVRPVSVSALSDVISLVGARVPVDLLFDRLPGRLSFEHLRSRCDHVRVGSRKALTATLADIIRSKEAANRPKDRAQLPILRQTLLAKEALKRRK